MALLSKIIEVIVAPHSSASSLLLAVEGCGSRAFEPARGAGFSEWGLRQWLLCFFEMGSGAANHSQGNGLGIISGEQT